MAKNLVVYFSASGVTRKVAERLAEVVGGDLYEIRPAVPYTKADLNWMDGNSRSSLEMKDENCRPKMIEDGNIQEYDTVYVGFPIWWYREPSIIDTFLEKYDFSGKTVVPFATSGSSGMGDTAKRMRKIAGDNVTVKDGARLKANVSAEELEKFAEQNS